LGVPTTVLETIVDLERFTPAAEKRDTPKPVIGWIGMHSTFPYLQKLFPVLKRLAERHQFILRIVGAGRPITEPGIEIESLPWRLDREIPDLQSFDLAVYPLTPDPWAEGKSGLKAIQYLACGVPYVASPVGVVAEIGRPGVTHFEATNDEEWLTSLSRLLTDATLRAEMGRRGREHAVEHYSIERAAAKLADVFRGVHAASEHQRRIS
jgi:glycosyltransferase involved in cell wall biosynthesis